MNDWMQCVADVRRAGVPGILVTIAQVKGSTPREPGTKMLVTHADVRGTIGGGNLEFKSIEIARAMLVDGDFDTTPVTLRRFPLGPGLGQCCGGVAVLLFEPVAQSAEPHWFAAALKCAAHRESAAIVTCTGTLARSAKQLVTPTKVIGGGAGNALMGRAAARARAVLARGGTTELVKIKTPAGDAASVLIEPIAVTDFHIVLFGAGHVGKALVNVLAPLGCTIDWVDGRADQLPAVLPATVRPKVTQRADLAVDAAPAGSFFVVMTHSHPLDQVICERVLRRDDIRYCGLIGSASKRNRFRKRLREGGLSEAALARLTCPIGIDGISGKQPAEIAIAVSAELLQIREREVRRPVGAERKPFDAVEA